MKRITLDDLTAKATETETSDDRGTFLAPFLTGTITDPEGNVVAEFKMEPKAFSPKSDGLGGCGWYANIPKGQATFKGLPLNGGMRLSVQGLKIRVGDVVDLDPKE